MVESIVVVRLVSNESLSSSGAKLGSGKVLNMYGEERRVV
jgi:hypothetical protein